MYDIVEKANLYKQKAEEWLPEVGCGVETLTVDYERNLGVWQNCLFSVLIVVVVTRLYGLSKHTGLYIKSVNFMT